MLGGWAKDAKILSAEYMEHGLQEDLDANIQKLKDIYAQIIITQAKFNTESNRAIIKDASQEARHYQDALTSWSQLSKQ